MKTICVIPARYASTRLPGKPLADICGKPMIQWVYERACQARLSAKTVVATDDQLVYQAVQDFGGQVLMTSDKHRSGTDRLAEVAEYYPDADLIVNVQGDEPLIPPAIIDLLISAFKGANQPDMATLKCRLSETEYANPAAVKVVTDVQDNALYFSRSLIPYPREQSSEPVYKHLGVYAYQRDFLLKFASLPVGKLEQTESLEQLRALEHGYKIRVLTVDYDGVGVDTPADLERVRQILAGA